MSYSLRQALPLLTKPELSLFESSRPPAIKELSAKQLATKITRTRALRDKYRDLYRRQSVQTQERSGAQRKPLGGENERTSAKAEILAEVLGRLEAQHAKLTAAADKAARRASATPAKAAKAASPAGAGAAKPTTRKTAASRAASSAAAPASSKPAARKSSAKPATPTLQGLVQAVRKATRKAAAEEPQAGARSSGAKKSNSPVTSGARGLAQGHVSTDLPAKALRENPLKAKPVNKKIHAAQRSQHAQHEARRDARGTDAS
ncbi:MAG: hypothetical protein KA914_14610 [Ottowia sp.]|nr:hypothetical protein [Ottowia sp.]